MEITKKEFININNKFDEYKIKEEKAFEYIEGKEKIIVSAPHSVRQIRNGNIKGKDSCTGTIAILLQKQLNCYCLYKTKNCNDDANYDIENNPYKDKIIDLVEKNNINFLLDIHGAKDGQAKIEEIQKDYAILKTDVDAAESAQKSEESTDNTENAESKENTDNTDNSNNEEKTENTEETKKIAKLSVAGNEYDIEKIEKNVIRAKIGSQTSNNTTVNNNVSKAAELAMLINSGKYPVDYKVQNNRFVYSDITHTQLIYAALVVAALIIIVFIIFIVKYKTKGLLVSISCVGFIALFFLLLRYTNVTISIEGIGAIILTMIIYLKLNQMILNKTKVMDVVNEAVKATYKNLFLKLVPVMIITVVFCFSGWTNLSSFGMIMFWGLALLALYNVIVTKTLLKLNENK